MAFKLWRQSLLANAYVSIPAVRTLIYKQKTHRPDIGQNAFFV